MHLASPGRFVQIRQVLRSQDASDSPNTHSLSLFPRFGASPCSGHMKQITEAQKTRRYRLLRTGFLRFGTALGASATRGQRVAPRSSRSSDAWTLFSRQKGPDHGLRTGLWKDPKHFSLAGWFWRLEMSSRMSCHEFH